MSLGNVEDVKAKWKQIRETYSKFKKRRNSSSGSEGKNTKMYHLAPSLDFLDPVLGQSRLVKLSDCFVK